MCICIYTYYRGKLLILFSLSLAYTHFFTKQNYFFLPRSTCFHHITVLMILTQQTASYILSNCPVHTLLTSHYFKLGSKNRRNIFLWVSWQCSFVQSEFLKCTLNYSHKNYVNCVKYQLILNACIERCSVLYVEITFPTDHVI